MESTMSVEVERKFVCDADIQKQLEEIGAVCIGQKQFQDKYFDTPDFLLTLRDVWLRCRQGCWELKCATVTKAEDRVGEPQKAELCSRYQEITNLSQIQLKVREFMKEGNGEQKTANQTHPVVHQDTPKTEGAENCPTGNESWLMELNLVCFAEFTTQRCSFTFGGEGDESGVRVDLDQADFGYCVGEIEVLVPQGEDIQSALRKIEKTAQRLGLSGDQRVQGKMDVYLQRYCPEHYAKLLSAYIL
ncbi:thiamine-triphosphatase [Oncorhynchus nerka]|uniref:thiamine-triphosphatase n=1 Tax=Oncorhynchus nerka TaxID=8023 RepID=UPI0011309D7F|nr:thiamine-triphosphatase [Oncorhynchus nerka]